MQIACVLATDDFAEKDQYIAAAMDIAKRFSDTDLEFDALAYQGVCLGERGRIEEGMRKLDEAAAAAQGGEVRAFTAVGEIYCRLLLACEMALDVRRAEQSVAVHDGGYRTLRSGALVRLADLRIQQGRFEEAEHLIAGHEHDGYAVRRWLGPISPAAKVEIAATVLRRQLDQTSDGVLQAPVLPLLAGWRWPRGEQTKRARSVPGFSCSPVPRAATAGNSGLNTAAIPDSGRARGITTATRSCDARLASVRARSRRGTRRR